MHPRLGPTLEPSSAVWETRHMTTAKTCRHPQHQRAVLLAHHSVRGRGRIERCLLCQVYRTQRPDGTWPRWPASKGGQHRTSRLTIKVPAEAAKAEVWRDAARAEGVTLAEFTAKALDSRSLPGDSFWM